MRYQGEGQRGQSFLHPGTRPLWAAHSIWEWRCPRPCVCARDPSVPQEPKRAWTAQDFSPGSSRIPLRVLQCRGSSEAGENQPPVLTNPRVSRCGSRSCHGLIYPGCWTLPCGMREGIPNPPTLPDFPCSPRRGFPAAAALSLRMEPRGSKETRG